MNELRVQLASQREKLSKSEQSLSQERQTATERREQAELLRRRLREIGLREEGLPGKADLNEYGSPESVNQETVDQQPKPDSKNEQADENEPSRLLAEITEIRESVNLDEAKRVLGSHLPVLRKIEEDFGWFLAVEGSARGGREYSVDAAKRVIGQKKAETEAVVRLLQNSGEESGRVKRQFDAAKAHVDKASHSPESLVDAAPDGTGKPTSEANDVSQFEKQWARAIERSLDELYSYGLEQYPDVIKDLHDRAQSLLGSGLDIPGEANMAPIKSVIELAQRARTMNTRIGAAIDEFSKTLNNAAEAEARRPENQ